MSAYTYIKKLQNKDENARKQILVASLVVSMAVVGSVWAYSLTDRFSSHSVAQAQTTPTTTKPFAMFTQSISNAYTNIAASVGNISFSKKVDTTEEKQIDLIVVEHPTE